MNLFLIVILVVAGYFALFSWVMARSDNRWSISVMLLVVLRALDKKLSNICWTIEYMVKLSIVISRQSQEGNK